MHAGLPALIQMTVRDANAYLEAEQIEQLDQLVEEGVYDSRSDAIRDAVDHMLRERGKL